MLHICCYLHCYPTAQPQVEPLVKSYLGNSLHLLASMTQPEMSAYTLRRLRPSAAFFGPYPRLTKKLLKLGLELFGSGEKENAPRLQVQHAAMSVSYLSITLGTACADVSYAYLVQPV
jgi:hypothetical protein